MIEAEEILIVTLMMIVRWALIGLLLALVVEVGHLEGTLQQACPLLMVEAEELDDRCFAN